MNLQINHKTFSGIIRACSAGSLLLLMLYVTACSKGSGNIPDTKTPITTTTEKGPFSTQDFVPQQKNEDEAIKACTTACEKVGGSYQSQQGTDAGSYYILAICNCWKD